MLLIESRSDTNGPSAAPASRPAPAAPSAVPRYQRVAPTFEAMLGASADRVIPAMDAAGDDIPHQRPEFPVALPSVGLDREHVPVRIVDPLGSGEIVSLTCRVEVRTAVPPERRGIHTSRIGRAIAESSAAAHASLQAFARAVARRIDDSEYGLGTEVRAEGVLSYLEEVPGWKEEKDKISLEHLTLHASARVEAERTVESAGITFNHITACPCVQQTYKHALMEAKGDVAGALETVGPMLTHSQRCRSTVLLRGIEGDLPVREMLEALDATLYRVQNTLPREHELLLVYRAHHAPQFIEDAMRQVLARIGATFGDRHPGATVAVKSVSFESIHDYDIVADIEVPVRDLTAAGASR